MNCEVPCGVRVTPKRGDNGVEIRVGCPALITNLVMILVLPIGPPHVLYTDCCGRVFRRCTLTTRRCLFVRQILLPPLDQLQCIERCECVEIRLANGIKQRVVVGCEQS